MTVARSAAPAAAARSAITSSPTSAPAARSESRSDRSATVRQRGHPVPEAPMMSPYEAVSAKQARAPESERIHSACSAEEVS
jgi:hypothetical protein